jgi:hypothetical protein
MCNKHETYISFNARNDASLIDYYISKENTTSQI